MFIIPLSEQKCHHSTGLFDLHSTPGPRLRLGFVVVISESFKCLLELVAILAESV